MCQSRSAFRPFQTFRIVLKVGGVAGTSGKNQNVQSIFSSDRCNSRFCDIPTQAGSIEHDIYVGDAQ